MKTKKLFRYREKFYKYINLLASIEKAKNAVFIYERILIIIRKFIELERKGKVNFQVSMYELEQNFINRRKQILDKLG
jgi:hypothetical protein